MAVVVRTKDVPCHRIHVLRRDWTLACRHFSSALDEAGEEAMSSAVYKKVLDAEFYYAMGRGRRRVCQGP